MTETITEFGPRRTVIILAIVAGCFAILWPKIFYPMLQASVIPSHSADSSGCCDVIFESDVTAVDIMQELCHNIIKHHHVDPRVRDALDIHKFKKLTPSNTRLCKEEVLTRCGIDLSSFLAEKEQLKKSYKQVLEEIRGSNRSLCLKMEFGVPLSRLGTPHLIRYHILMPHSNIKQERQTPPHAGSYHPALRERGRAIPSSHIVPRIQDRPDHVAPMKMRPPMGGAGHVVSAPKGSGSLGLLMPLYTIGIVIFFLYTISKVLMGIVIPIYTIGNVLSFLYKILQVLRKAADNEIVRPEYSTAAAEREYQKLVFNPELFAAAVTAINGSPERKETYVSPSTDSPPTIDELQTHQTLKSNGLAAGVNPNLKNLNSLEETLCQEEKELEAYHEPPSVKVINMEMTTSCEGGVKCSRPNTPIITPPSNVEEKEKSPPISIYLEGALPSQCELLVTDSKIQEIQEKENVEVPVVLSGKMTLSVISLDQESQDNNQLESAAISEITSNREENLLGNDNKYKTEVVNENLNTERINLASQEQLKIEESEESYEHDNEKVDNGDKNKNDEYNNTGVINSAKSVHKNYENQELLKNKYEENSSKSITYDDYVYDISTAHDNFNNNNKASPTMTQREKKDIFIYNIEENFDRQESNNDKGMEDVEEVEDEYEVEYTEVEEEEEEGNKEDDNKVEYEEEKEYDEEENEIEYEQEKEDEDEDNKVEYEEEDNETENEQVKKDKKEDKKLEYEEENDVEYEDEKEDEDEENEVEYEDEEYEGDEEEQSEEEDKIEGNSRKIKMNKSTIVESKK